MSTWDAWCTAWMRDEKKLLIFGYVREQDTDRDLVKDLKYLILKFYDEVIYWSFKTDEEMESFLNFPNGQEMKGPKFEIPDKGITFQNTLSPNGFSKERPGFVEYYCDCLGAKEEEFIITAYIVLSCKQTKYQHKVTKVFKYKDDWEVWAGICMPLQDVKDNGYTSLDFGCYVDILHIEYFKDKPKENENGEEKN